MLWAHWLGLAIFGCFAVQAIVLYIVGKQQLHLRIDRQRQHRNDPACSGHCKAGGEGDQRTGDIGDIRV